MCCLKAVNDDLKRFDAKAWGQSVPASAGFLDAFSDCVHSGVAITSLAVAVPGQPERQRLLLQSTSSLALPLMRLPIFDGAAFSLNLPVDLDECLEPAAKADGGGDAPSAPKISPPARVVAKTRICAACKRTGHQRNSKKCPMHPSNVDVLDDDQLCAQ